MKEAMKVSIIVTAILMVILVLSLSAKNIFAARPAPYDYYSDSTYGNTLSTTGNTATGSNTANTANVANVVDGVQIVNLKVQGGQYVLTTSVLKKGVPVRMIADVNNMPGCSKAFTIKDFGISKYITVKDNIIEFTPDKTGTFVMACTMNMYRGTFTVTDDGSAPTGAAAQQATQVAATTAASTGGSCGASGAGCGCGG